jgi:hypothetical protein
MNEPIDLTPSCASCRYSVMKDHLKGTCNRSAPKPAIGITAVNWALWPMIHASDWCGEWTLPATDDELFADFLARNTGAMAMPLLDGIPMQPTDDPAPNAPAFPTYDEPFEDPLR